MKCLITTAILFSLSTGALCQSKKISVFLIYENQVGGIQVLENSLVKNYGSPLFEVSRFYIRVDKASFNRVSKEFRIIGKVCSYSKEKNCIGLPNVDIFKAQKTEENLPRNTANLGESSFVQDSLNKNGFFDVKFKIEKGESLFFYMPHFYLEEFKLGGFIDKMKTTKKRKTVHHQ